jgi:secreted trypsin-like serine protease
MRIPALALGSALGSALGAALAFAGTPAHAITGNAPDAAGAVGRAIVMITGAGSRLCTGTAVARDIVLTAAHCVQGNVVVRTSKTSAILAIRTAAIHPRFDRQAYAQHRATADVALVKLAAPLPPQIAPAELALPGLRVAAGDRMTIAGFGITSADSDAGLGQPRSAALVVTGQPGTLQVRLYDPATRNARTGLGACTGDSGGPAFAGERIAGVVSWTTGPGNSAGCGGLTGITPLTRYRDWVVEQIERLQRP